MGKNIPDMKKMTVEEFAGILASSEPIPGGGGVSALVAALGAALGSMVCSLTTGKKKYEKTQPELDLIIPRLEEYRIKLLDGMKADAEVFLPLAEAYSLPKATEEESRHRDEVLEKLLLEAAKTPLILMDDIIRVMDLLEKLSRIGSRLAVSDVGVGISLCKAAVDSAALNVFINTKMMKDRKKAAQLNIEADELKEESSAICRWVMSEVISAVRY